MTLATAARRGLLVPALALCAIPLSLTAQTALHFENGAENSALAATVVSVPPDTFWAAYAPAAGPGENALAGRNDAGAATESSSTAPLPDAPGTLLSAAEATLGQAGQQQITGLVPPQDPPDGRTPPIAPLRWKYIPAGYQFHHLSQGDKVYIAFRDLYSPLDLGAVFISAGFSHLRNSSPRYGSDRGAFGERLGAAELREISQGIFVDAVFAPLFHQDPRFFGEGPSHDATHRTFHALSRVLITRNDNGTHGPNLSLWAGHAAAAALTPLYYPPANRNANDVASSFGFSLVSAGLGFIIDEYLDDVLEAVHFERKP